MVLHKALKYLVLLLSIIAMAFFFYTLAVGDEAIELNTDGSQAVTVSPLIVLAYITLGLTILIVLVFVLKGLASNPEALKKAGISVGLMLLVALISYFVLADNSVVDINGKVIEVKDGEPLTPGTSQWIGASLYMFYILAAVAVGTVIWSGVSKLIKK
jgi:glucan phosphoethanolaminetransferase (alkaline phosphatase superfamily)